MLKKLTFLVVGFGLLCAAGLSSAAAADNPINESHNAGPVVGSSESGLPREVDPLLGAIFKTCTAQLNCPAPFDGPIICTGSSSCQVYSYHVKCDGNEVVCSCSIAPSGCSDPVGYCACRSQGFAHGRCALWNCV
jgi:hypothetical protein